MSGVNQETVDAYFKKTPAPEMDWKKYFPVVQQSGSQWKTLANKTYSANVASDPAALGSSAPVKGRTGTETIQGGFGVFKVAREKDEIEIQEFNRLKADFSKTSNVQQYEQILSFLGDDLDFVRNAALSQANYLNWALLTSACNLGYIAANSPQLTSLKNISYPIQSWQKVAAGTTWADASAKIVDDINTWVKAAKAKGKIIKKLKVNETWFQHIQANEQVQKLCATYVQNALGLQGLPTEESINAMIKSATRSTLDFEVIDEIVTREATNGEYTSANPFADGVMVMTIETRTGSFQYENLSSNPNIISVAEDFYRTERLYQPNPDMEITLSKFSGMAVIDTYADNMYVKIDAVAW